MKNNTELVLRSKTQKPARALTQRAIVLFFAFVTPQAVMFKSQGIPVYLSPEHSLATGHYSKKTLEEKTELYDVDLWLKVKTSQAQEGWIHSDQALLPVDFSQKAQLKDHAPVRVDPALGAPILIGSDALTIVKVLSRSGAWVKIQNPKAPFQIGYTEVRSLTPAIRDIGYFFTLEEIGAYKKINGSEYKKIQKGTKLRPLSLKKGWFRVEIIAEPAVKIAERKVRKLAYKKEEFYISSDSSLLSRLKFAESVKTEKGFVDPLSVNLVQDKVYEIQSRTNWLFSQSLPVQLSRSAEKASLPIRTLSSFEPLILSTQDYQRWGKANLSGDQLWWRSREDQDLTLKSLELSLKEIRSRNLYDFAKSPLNPQIMIASAGGIFHTNNGVTWNSLPTFKAENQPIAFSENGLLFVGSMVSRDNGKSFEPYIRWDELIHALTLQKSKRFDNVRITKISPQDRFGKDIKLNLESGMQSIQVRTKDGGLTWQKTL